MIGLFIYAGVAMRSGNWILRTKSKLKELGIGDFPKDWFVPTKQWFLLDEYAKELGFGVDGPDKTGQTVKFHLEDGSFCLCSNTSCTYSLEGGKEQQIMSERSIIKTIARNAGSDIQLDGLIVAKIGDDDYILCPDKILAETIRVLRHLSQRSKLFAAEALPGPMPIETASPIEEEPLAKSDPEVDSPAEVVED